jgi:hypothetical protein
MNPKQVEHNDDGDFDPEEIEAAADERITPSNPPEVDSNTESLTEWDQTPARSAGGAPRTPPLEDETAIPEEWIEEGIEEADREQRIAAADPDFEP